MSAIPATVPTFREILLEQLRPSTTPAQIARRKSFDQAHIDTLAASIKESGVLQPIVVREVPTKGKTPGHYEIVAGERRFLAAGIAGLDRIPATVHALTDDAVVRIQLVENLQREGLDPMHEAESYHDLVANHGVAVEAIAAKIGESVRYVHRRLKLMALAPPARKALKDQHFSPFIAEALARIPTHALQAEAMKAIEYARDEKEAVKTIGERFMTKLSAASFPITDATLPGGACGACPKRTGNQPQLFADVGNEDVCTDVACFEKRTREWGSRSIAAAEKNGVRVVSMTEAKKHNAQGFRYNEKVGPYYRLDAKTYMSGHGEVAIKKMLKEDAETALLHDPHSGRAVEVVHESQLKKPKRETGGHVDSYTKERRENQKRARYENQVRMRVFTDVFARLHKVPPSLRVIAEVLAGALDYNAWEKIRPFYVEAGVCSKDLAHYSLGKTLLPKLKTDAQLQQWITTCWLSRELHVSSYERAPGMPRLEHVGKALGVNVAAIRKELKPKTKPAKKKAKKKTRGKR